MLSPGGGQSKDEGGGLCRAPLPSRTGRRSHHRVPSAAIRDGNSSAYLLRRVPDRVHALSVRVAIDLHEWYAVSVRAFVVEDDADARELVRDALEGLGWRVDTATDGVDALAQIRHAVPDLIVLDLRMPNVDGVAVLELLRSTEVGRRIAVVVTTGMAVDEHVRALASAVLEKPYRMADLLQTVVALTPPAPARP